MPRRGFVTDKPSFDVGSSLEDAKLIESHNIAKEPEKDSANSLELPWQIRPKRGSRAGNSGSESDLGMRKARPSPYEVDLLRLMRRDTSNIAQLSAEPENVSNSSDNVQRAGAVSHIKSPRERKAAVEGQPQPRNGGEHSPQISSQVVRWMLSNGSRYERDWDLLSKGSGSTGFPRRSIYTLIIDNQGSTARATQKNLGPTDHEETPDRQPRHTAFTASIGNEDTSCREKEGSCIPDDLCASVTRQRCAMIAWLLATIGATGRQSSAQDPLWHEDHCKLYLKIASFFRGSTQSDSPRQLHLSWPRVQPLRVKQLGLAEGLRPHVRLRTRPPQV
ncbi:hypothetical protein BDP55DRAFT_636672 [Colletotrichum godetiae]|uniref:Uncharacterized protein n=1 Tax=Colletotrichum godetiae TaxID=1209918 RepID=A0AAJ0EPG8_9PEZI|nr:uncharacterized protein BDP55DRAFT_636672 [Colletotrichum godetiae]KAK1659686.1 hypothetical protein BDP55DRAFT_636672 [Colletotrichum godetiae]